MRIFDHHYLKFSFKIEDLSNKVYLEKNVRGKVKWFNVKAGFGFVNR